MVFVPVNEDKCNAAEDEEVSWNLKRSNEDEELDDFCEVVVSFRCKQCSFICHDKEELKSHIKQNHRKGDSEDVNEVESVLLSQDAQHPFETSDEPLEKTNQDELNVSKDPIESRDILEEPQNVIDEIQEKHEEGEESNKGDEQGIAEVYLCAECDIIFHSEELCCQHMSQVHQLSQFSADFIREKFMQDDSNNEINENPPEKEPLKKRKVKLPSKFREESGVIVPKKFRISKESPECCSMCKACFNSLDSKVLHENCHSREGKGFICSICPVTDDEPKKVFSQWNKCANHLWKEHKIDCDLYACTSCQYKTHLMAKLKDHEKLHNTSFKFTCQICHKSFKQSKQLKTHEKFHTRNQTKLSPAEDARWYTPKECPICQRVLSDSKCLKKHISAVHNKLKPYMCNICGHTSARKAELQLHVRQHTGEKPYKCPKCPFETRDHNSLRNHKLKHSDIRKYSCPHCQYKCIQSAAFKKHVLLTHAEQEEVFVCSHCPLVSVNKKTFIAHEKDHTEGRIPPLESTEKIDEEENSECPINSEKGRIWPIGDEDSQSVDVVDFGGRTIPAPTTEFDIEIEQEKNNNSSNEDESLKESEQVEETSSIEMTISEGETVIEVMLPPPDPDSSNQKQSKSSENGKPSNSGIFFLFDTEFSLDLPDISDSESGNEGAFDKLMDMRFNNIN